MCCFCDAARQRRFVEGILATIIPSTNLPDVMGQLLRSFFAVEGVKERLRTHTSPFALLVSGHDKEIIL